jgi:uncharacterized membrane protein (UPF0136 family)
VAVVVVVVVVVAVLEGIRMGVLSKPSGVDKLYGLLLALGGLAGYASPARSTVSLVMGVGSGLIVTVAGHGVKSLWSLLLAVVMGRRFVGGGSFMPSGFVAVVAACMCAVNAKTATMRPPIVKKPNASAALDDGMDLSDPRGAAGGSGSDDFEKSPTPALVGLVGNKDVLSAEEFKFAESMVACGQAHLFSDWPAPGAKDSEKRAMLQGMMESDRLYGGGIEQYVKNAKELLAASKAGTNPLEGYSPSLPVRRPTASRPTAAQLRLALLSLRFDLLPLKPSWWCADWHDAHRSHARVGGRRGQGSRGRRHVRLHDGRGRARRAARVQRHQGCPANRDCVGQVLP